VFIDWSSMIVTAALPAGAVRELASVARIVVSPTDSGADTGAKLVTSLFGVLPPSVRNPSLASSASWSGLRRNRENSLAAVTCSWDSQFPLSRTVG
jgi:hypothetical protein